MKRVNFNLNDTKIFTTYSRSEYDRLPIDSILQSRCYNRVTCGQWNNLLKNLNKYKMTEMTVHKDSVCNMTLH